MKRPEDYLNRPRRAEHEQPVFVGTLVDEYIEFLEARRIWLLNPQEFCLKGNQDWYRDTYLFSYHWQQNVRLPALEYAEYRCQVCGAGNRVLDVHHKTYERLGFESADDLIVLCRDCHEIEHGLQVR